MFIQNKSWTDGRLEFSCPDDREYESNHYTYTLDIVDGKIEVWHPDGAFVLAPQWWSLN